MARSNTSGKRCWHRVCQRRSNVRTTTLARSAPRSPRPLQPPGPSASLCAACPHLWNVASSSCAAPRYSWQACRHRQQTSESGGGRDMRRCCAWHRSHGRSSPKSRYLLAQTGASARPPAPFFSLFRRQKDLWKTVYRWRA